MVFTGIFHGRYKLTIDKGRNPNGDSDGGSVMRTGKELILATKPYAADSAVRSWWYVLSTAFLLAISLAGTLWNFHWAGKIVCSFFAGLLILRLFVIYHDQQHQAILSRSRLAA